MKFAEQVSDWLVEDGYTHCFFVAGGNIMHMLDAARSRFTCVPFVHEVAAGIAAEYFNECATEGEGKAFALVTAGPGLTNVVTALAGAFLESRELLVIGGQVKSTDLAGRGMRQRGIQEIDGIGIAAPVCVATLAIAQPMPRDAVMNAVRRAGQPRKGPVFIEFCLDAQGAPVAQVSDPDEITDREAVLPAVDHRVIGEVAHMLAASDRPVILIGGGLSREHCRTLMPRLTALGIPLATTWNGADRIGAEHPLYFGRPNTWGMRWSNVLLQQADTLLAVGTRLGMQQTGFNWQAFAPGAKIVHVDVDPVELEKGHPITSVKVRADAGDFLDALTERLLKVPPAEATQERWRTWLDFGRRVKAALPLADPENEHDSAFIDPYEFVLELSRHLRADDLVVPCSSGGAFTVAMQALQNKAGQTIVTNKGLASMGYGLSGAIGAALVTPGRRTILIEGDGGFAQNLQELGTVAASALPLKMFLFCNEGYASIRMTQRNYFGGAYVGCDTATGLGLPDWETLFTAYGIAAVPLDAADPLGPAVVARLESPEPAAFLVPIDPEQTYFPKISSRVTASGAMESNPLHRMSPDLPPDLEREVLAFLPEGQL